MNKITQVLIISPEPWDGHFVSKHHYAITLASRGYDVYFLNPPQNNINVVNLRETKYKHLWEVNGPQVTKGLRFYPKSLRNTLERKWLEGLERQIGHRFTSIWLFENSRFYDMTFAGKRLKIYHQVDLNQDLHVMEAVKSADICFCTTDYIKSELLRFTDKVYKIHHGFAWNYHKDSSLSREQNELFNSSKINVAYIGNLDISFLDIDLFILLLKNYPEVTFHLVGDYSREKELYRRCKSYENVKWWGRIASDQIPIILKSVDILLVIYKANNSEEMKQLASPHKMMEYLASGKVMVSTYTDEYKDKLELLEMVDNADDYLKKFDEVANNLAFHNSKEKQEKRTAFAKSHSYDRQLDKIVDYLKQYNLEL
jgi:glycosyltransferase involved in cell wall biosynthesis